ncbi:uncharacterized 2Fe-2S/4Fe-4S cluster protein (DUF4445 family) [Anaerotaenia torta]|uniref:ASKHA domain-containing protein n=1 Tax=Anaerotaenia torta TaxID=433293 RepID=UPI003D1DE9CA
MKIEHEKVSIDRNMVFHMIDCKADSPVYDDMIEAYQELLPEVLRLVEGRTVFGIGEIKEEDATKEYPAGTKVLYVISTVGAELSHLGTRMFQRGDYVKGMLADAMADLCLFDLEEQWQEHLRVYCAEKKVGIEKRLTAPHDLPMSIQKTAYESLNAEIELNMHITSGFMYDPVKSVCHVLILSEDPLVFQAQHDCRKCPQHSCKARKISAVKIKVRTEAGETVIYCEETENILRACLRQGFDVSAVCGGNGTCGKCKIRLVSGELKIMPEDRLAFREKEMEQGWRLACRAYPQEECTIEAHFTDASDFSAVEHFGREGKIIASHTKKEGPAIIAHAGIAIDIGTTTIAAQLINLENGEIQASESSMNHQRSYGADVISRIGASNRGEGEALQKLLRTDLEQLICQSLKHSGCAGTAVEQLILAGNTTIGHLLMGYSCKTLGVFPFRPVNIDLIEDSCKNIIGTETISCRTRIFPGISTFVGGDIIAGLYACGFENSQEIDLLVDLGTNGEMAIGNNKRLLVTSTAAGPAFEGGNISCGTGSIPGAICHVCIEEEHRVSFETIHGQPPTGICGTGVIELVAELLRHDLMDETGLLAEEYFKNGFLLTTNTEGKEIRFTQSDIREFQLAKSAIRAGVEILIKRYGITGKSIGHVYLAGGFGFKMNREAAVAVGLFPEELKEKIIPVGNSSLAGAVKALGESMWVEHVHGLIDIADEVTLSNDPDFNDLYIEYMLFGEA